VHIFLHDMCIFSYSRLLQICSVFVCICVRVYYIYTHAHEYKYIANVINVPEPHVYLYFLSCLLFCFSFLNTSAYSTSHVCNGTFQTNSFVFSGSPDAPAPPPPPPPVDIAAINPPPDAGFLSLFYAQYLCIPPPHIHTHTLKTTHNL
jgi:hypothetical protein